MDETTEANEANGLTAWVSKQEYVPKQLIAVVVHNSIADVNPHMGAAVKALVEVHPITIATLDNDFILRETSTGPVDAIAIKYLPIYSARVPLFRYAEKFGKAITHLSGQLAVLQSKYDSTKIEECSIDVLFIEPDATLTVAVDAWVCRNLRLKRFTGPTAYRAPDSTHKADILCAMHWEGSVVHVHHGVEGEIDVLAFANAELKKINAMSSNPYSGLMKATSNVVSLNKPT